MPVFLPALAGRYLQASGLAGQVDRMLLAFGGGAGRHLGDRRADRSLGCGRWCWGASCCVSRRRFCSGQERRRLHSISALRPGGLRRAATLFQTASAKAAGPAAGRGAIHDRYRMEHCHCRRWDRGRLPARPDRTALSAMKSVRAPVALPRGRVRGTPPWLYHEQRQVGTPVFASLIKAAGIADLIGTTTSRSARHF